MRELWTHFENFHIQDFSTTSLCLRAQCALPPFVQGFWDSIINRVKIIFHIILYEITCALPSNSFTTKMFSCFFPTKIFNFFFKCLLYNDLLKQLILKVPKTYRILFFTVQYNTEFYHCYDPDTECKLKYKFHNITLKSTLCFVCQCVADFCLPKICGAEI